jgi:hypothetical protein
VREGDAVAYRDDFGKAIITRTRSPASVLSGHTAVVWIEGKSGCVMLDRVAPIVTGAPITAQADARGAAPLDSTT